MNIVDVMFVNRECVLQSFQDREEMAQGYIDCIHGRPCHNDRSPAYLFGYGSAYHVIEAGAANSEIQ